MYDTNNEPVRRGRDEVIERGRDVMWLLEQVGEDAFACRLCGSQDVEGQSIPSVYGDDDIIERCDACGAHATTDSFAGITTIYRKATD